MNHDLLLNNNFNKNSIFLKDNYNHTPQKLNNDFIQSKILNRNLRNNPANYDILIEGIIEDLLVENVFELQEIEEKQEKLKQKEHMRCFIKDYYKNFEDIKKLEDNVFEKLNSNDYGIRLNPQKPKMVLDGKEDRRHIIYKNPFEATINKSIHQINQNSIIIENDYLNNKKPNKRSSPKIKFKINPSIKKNNLNQSINSKNDGKSRSKEKELKNKNHKKRKSSEINRSKSRESLKSPKAKSPRKHENSSISIKNQAQQSIAFEDNTTNLQEKITQNFMNHLITTDYNFNCNPNNPKSASNLKNYYVVKLHKNLPEICEKYKNEYNDYMKTTGAFFVPNVFMLYEDVVNKLTNEIFEECASRSFKELDEMALNLVKSEVENKF